MARDKRKKIEGGGEISVGNSDGLSLSIASMLGKPDGEAGASEAQSAGRAPVERGEADADYDDPFAFIRGAAQATLHRSSAGRGGRTVTIVTMKPAPKARVAEALAGAMRKGLGCGSHVEGERIVLQGDIQGRAKEWLIKQGAKKVVMGN